VAVEGGAPWWAGTPAFLRTEPWAQSRALEHLPIGRLARAIGAEAAAAIPRRGDINVYGRSDDELIRQLDRRERKERLLEDLGRRYC
jgi:hypothetical protein